MHALQLSSFSRCASFKEKGLEPVSARFCWIPSDPKMVTKEDQLEAGGGGRRWKKEGKGFLSHVATLGGCFVSFSSQTPCITVTRAEGS